MGRTLYSKETMTDAMVTALDPMARFDQPETNRTMGKPMLSRGWARTYQHPQTNEVIYLITPKGIQTYSDWAEDNTSEEYFTRILPQFQATMIKAGRREASRANIMEAKAATDAAVKLKPENRPYMLTVTDRNTGETVTSGHDNSGQALVYASRAYGVHPARLGMLDRDRVITVGRWRLVITEREAVTA